MKHIKAAWIEQVLEFDTKIELEAFLQKLESNRAYRGKQYKILEQTDTSVRVRIQYNNNSMELKEGE